MAVARLNSVPRIFVLIHGGWHGAWCWQRVVPLLRAAGHAVLAPDLPSMGDDQADPATVTLASGRIPIQALLAAVEADEQTEAVNEDTEQLAATEGA